MKTVAVIIPFYQRARGILRRALDAVNAQILPEDVRLNIYVVDDESPMSVDEELQGFSVVPPHSLTLIKQINSGPGGARNTGLDALDAAEVDYVAFLDSDDIWGADHVITALEAMKAGAGFYFCNHTRFDTDADWFSSHVTSRPWLTAQSSAEVVRAGDILTMPGPKMFDALLDEYVSQTSTVVYDFPSNKALRFDAELRGAGEDHMFWLNLSRLNTCTVCLTPKVHCADGINIYAGAFSWGDAKSVDRYGYLVLFLSKLMGLQGLNDGHKAKIKFHLDKNTRAYTYLLIRSLIKKFRPNFSILKRIIGANPSFVLSAPVNLGIVLIRREKEIATW